MTGEREHQPPEGITIRFGRWASLGEMGFSRGLTPPTRWAGLNMTIRVLLFAKLRDAAGADSVTMDLPPDATIADLRRRLADTYPELVGLMERSAVAVNHDFADDLRRLQSGDEVAIIPPVSGG